MSRVINERVFEYIDYTVSGENLFLLFYMGVGTGYTILRSRTIMYDVAHRFSSLMVVAVFGLYFGLLLSLGCTSALIIKSSLQHTPKTPSPSVWRGCIKISSRVSLHHSPHSS